MSEPAIMGLLGSGPVLWMLGGYRWKWLRRFVWPLIVTGALATVMPFFFAALVGLTTCGVCTLPYGEKFTWRKKEYRMPWPLRLLVFCCLGLSGVWLDTPFCLFYALGTMIVLGSVCYLSQRYNRVTWKLWEGLAGFLQAAGIVLASLR